MDIRGWAEGWVHFSKLRAMIMQQLHALLAMRGQMRTPEIVIPLRVASGLSCGTSGAMHIIMCFFGHLACKASDSGVVRIIIVGAPRQSTAQLLLRGVLAEACQAVYHEMHRILRQSLTIAPPATYTVPCAYHQVHVGGMAWFAAAFSLILSEAGFANWDTHWAKAKKAHSLPC